MDKERTAIDVNVQVDAKPVEVKQKKSHKGAAIAAGAGVGAVGATAYAAHHGADTAAGDETADGGGAVDAASSAATQVAQTHSTPTAEPSGQEPAAHITEEQMADLRAELKDELRNELKDELRDEIKDELLHDDDFVAGVSAAGAAEEPVLATIEEPVTDDAPEPVVVSAGEETAEPLDVPVESIVFFDEEPESDIAMEGGAEVPSDEITVEVLDYSTGVTPDGRAFDAASVDINGTHTTLIDVDQDNIADVMVVDVNGNSMIDDPDVVVDISDKDISMQDLCVAAEQHDIDLLESGGDFMAEADMNDFVNDADVSDFLV